MKKPVLNSTISGTENKFQNICDGKVKEIYKIVVYHYLWIQ